MYDNVAIANRLVAIAQGELWDENTLRVAKDFVEGDYAWFIDKIICRGILNVQDRLFLQDIAHRCRQWHK